MSESDDLLKDLVGEGGDPDAPTAEWEATLRETALDLCKRHKIDEEHVDALVTALRSVDNIFEADRAGMLKTEHEVIRENRKNKPNAELPATLEMFRGDGFMVERRKRTELDGFMVERRTLTKPENRPLTWGNARFASRAADRMKSTRALTANDRSNFSKEPAITFRLGLVLHRRLQLHLRLQRVVRQCLRLQHRLQQGLRLQQCLRESRLLVEYETESPADADPFGLCPREALLYGSRAFLASALAEAAALDGNARNNRTSRHTKHRYGPSGRAGVIPAAAALVRFWRSTGKPVQFTYDGAGLAFVDDALCLWTYEAAHYLHAHRKDVLAQAGITVRSRPRAR